MEDNNIIDSAQHGFRKDYRTTDSIFILKTIISKYKDKKCKLYPCFIDFRKAFDTVQTPKTWYIWQYVQSDQKHVQYADVTYRVKTNSGLSEPFASDLGVKQGCVCSPLFFNLYINDLCEYLNTDMASSPLLYNTPVSHLLFQMTLSSYLQQKRDYSHPLISSRTFVQTGNCQ